MERGESSSSNADVWAKLVPSSSQYSDIELTSEETLVCSEITISSPEKTEWCKITRNMDLVSATLQTTRDGKVLVDEMVVQGNDTAVIRCGSEIIPGSDSNGKGGLCGPVTLAHSFLGPLRYRFKIMPTQESGEKQLKISLDAEHTKCCICLNVWHDVVTVGPCLHNFCNGCFSEWLRRSQVRHANVLCPQCRAVVQFVARNHFLHSIEEDVLNADNSLRRSAEELAVLDSYASIKTPLVMATAKKRKRPRSPSEQENRDEPSCPQCGTEYAGHRCNPSTIHLQCHACGGMMPSGRSGAVPQHCLGCDRAFCGAYWHSQGVTRSDSHPTCSPETFKPIAERTTTRIPFWVHEKNRHEHDITESCIRQMGRSLQDVISEWITKLENQELDRTLMQINHAEMITAQSHTCNDCYDKIVSFLLYWFRITMPLRYLLGEASQREDCWYGFACRTQHHNEEHARKRNHVCRPTRGSRR